MTQGAVRGSVRRAWSLVLVLCCVFIAQGSGCDDENNTTIISGETLIESLFPGTPIADNNIGNDGQSLSDADLILNQGYVVFRNASNNTAILLYTDKAERLWAHFFNGTGFTPAVEIRGVNQLDFDADLGVTSGGFGGSDDRHETWRSYQVLFLNTGGSGNANAVARHGDALIIWNKEDFMLPPGADPDADENYRLYGTYFDASLASTPVSGDVRHGFDTTATTIDFDNQTPGSANDDSVSTAGFVSDSLVLSHSFPTHTNFGGNTEGPKDDEMLLEEPVLSGDPTSFVYIVWRKANNDGTGASTGARYHQVQFDLTAATNDIPSEASLGAGVLPLPAGISIDPGNNVDGGGPSTEDTGFVVHNGDMIWRSETIDAGLTDSTETLLFLTRFAASGSLATIEFGNTLTTADFPEIPVKIDVYGGDHGGLLALYAFFSVSGNINVSKSDLDAPLARETADISATPGDSNADFEDSRINRTADWLITAWIEGVMGGAPQVFARAVQTRGPGDGPRTLANSLGGVIQPANQDPTVGVVHVRLQSEIANGMSNPSCGVQSDRNRINFAFQQPNVSDASNQRLLHNGLVFTADGTGSAPPTTVAALAGPGDGFVDEHDTSYDFIGSDLRPVLTDLGASSGAPLIYYVRNDNNPTDASAPGAFTEIRVFGKPGVTGGVATLIGTDGTLVDNTLNDPMFDSSENPIDDLTVADAGDGNFLRVQTTPLNPNVGASPNHGGTLTHIFFEEARGGGNSLWALKTRVFQKTAFSEALPAGFGGAHSPPAPTSAPITLDGTLNNAPWIYPSFHEETDDVGVIGNMFVVQGNTVGVFFQSDDDQGAHFWYQEFSGSSWYTDAGQGDPQQIDNKFGSNAFFGHDQMGFAFPGFSNSACDNRAGTIACFIRNLPGDDPHVRRLFTRVIN